MSSHFDRDDFVDDLGGDPAAFWADGGGGRPAGWDEPLPARALGEPGADGVATGDLDRFHRNIVPLAERKRRILDALSDTVYTIGAELLEAKREHNGTFVAWVETELPFGIDRAERLMAVTRAFATAEHREHLPAAWTALYELSKVPPGALVRSIELGEVSPGMTVAQARDYVASQRANGETRHPGGVPPLAEAHAVALLRYHPNDVPEEVRCRLRAWINAG